jgi:hypothetical protein
MADPVRCLTVQGGGVIGVVDHQQPGLVHRREPSPEDVGQFAALELGFGRAGESGDGVQAGLGAGGVRS